MLTFECLSIRSIDVNRISGVIEVRRPVLDGRCARRYTDDADSTFPYVLALSDGFINRQTYLAANRKVRRFMHLAPRYHVPSAD
jgi:hypothetical protein